MVLNLLVGSFVRKNFIVHPFGNGLPKISKNDIYKATKATSIFELA